MTDGQGKTVDFRNTVIIMTSNAGARDISQDATVGFGTTGEQGLTADEIRGRAMGELKRLFRPEFLNRIDDIVVFKKLAGESLASIAKLLVDDLRQRLIANGMNIVLTDAAVDKIVSEGTDVSNGARPLRRAIQKLIEDPLSEELLAGEWNAGDTVECDVVDGSFVFTHGAGEIPAPREAGALGASSSPLRAMDMRPPRFQRRAAVLRWVPARASAFLGITLYASSTASRDQNGCGAPFAICAVMRAVAAESLHPSALLRVFFYKQMSAHRF